VEEQSPGPIPAQLRAAFNAAVAAYREWHWLDGKDEPQVMLKGPSGINAQPIPIGLVRELVAKYSDPMPEIEFEAIRMFARELNEALTDRSYAAGASLLLKLIAIRKNKYPPKRLPD
jgi:hypothetical protein